MDKAKGVPLRGQFDEICEHETILQALVEDIGKLNKFFCLAFNKLVSLAEVIEHGMSCLFIRLSNKVIEALLAAKESLNHASRHLYVVALLILIHHLRVTNTLIVRRSRPTVASAR